MNVSYFIMSRFKALPPKPDLKFKFIDDEDRKMVSVRLPKALLVQIERVAKRKGWPKTEIIQYALDQFCQMERGSSKS